MARPVQAVTQTTRQDPPPPSRQWATNPDHARAEALLAEIEDCSDPSRCTEMRRQAVVLTLDLADTVARRYRGRGMDPEDLVQVGRMVLLKAAHGYRCGCGSSFAAYAVPTISGEIKRHFRDHGWMVRPPRRLQEVRADLAREEDLLRHALLRDPSEAELAESLGLAVGEVRAARACSQAYHAVPLDGPPGVASHEPASEGPGLDELIAGRDSLARALQRLSPRERVIVQLRFVEERTQSQIGDVLGVSQMQVSRLLSSILLQLRDDLVEGAA
jgi:RNA polymerase sigma-B factor